MRPTPPIASLRAFGGRHQLAIAIAGSLATLAVLAVLLADRREEFGEALGSASLLVLVAAAALQALALVARSEAWHISIEAAGGAVERRVLYRASSMQVLGGLLNGHLGVAARIAALRRSSPQVAPQVPTLIAAEFPILAVEAMLAAATSFTLVGPLGLAWWWPLVALALVGAASAGLRHLAMRKGRELWRGLAVARSLSHGSRVIAFVLVAVFAQIFRNWILLRAVGVDASFFDAIAVLIAVVTLGQLPIGPGVGAAAAVLILGREGAAAAAAAGVLLTVTGTVGGLCFAAWGGGDHLWSRSRRARLRRARRADSAELRSTVVHVDLEHTDESPAADDEAIRKLIARLARPHASGGEVIERATILAAGADTDAILAWLAAHDAKPEADAPVAAGRGLHSARLSGGGSGAGPKPRRYVLPPGTLG